MNDSTSGISRVPSSYCEYWQGLKTAKRATSEIPTAQPNQPSPGITSSGHSSASVLSRSVKDSVSSSKWNSGSSGARKKTWYDWNSSQLGGGRSPSSSSQLWGSSDSVWHSSDTPWIFRRS